MLAAPPALVGPVGRDGRGGIVCRRLPPGAPAGLPRERRWRPGPTPFLASAPCPHDPREEGRRAARPARRRPPPPGGPGGVRFPGAAPAPVLARRAHPPRLVPRRRRRLPAHP